MKSIQDIRPSKQVPQKVVVVEEEPLDRASFTAKINELSNRLNYENKLTARERLLRTLHRYHRFGK